MPLQQRLGLEADHEARLKRRWLNMDNDQMVGLAIRSLFYLTFLHRRAHRNARDIQVRHHSFDVPGLAAPFHGYTILHLSDLHLDAGADFAGVLAERVADLDYDLCVLTGDYRFRTSGPLDDCLAAMQQVQAQLDGSVYAVLGNHDSIRMVPKMEAMGVRVLLNESIAIERDGAVLYLAGIDDPHFYRAENFDRACGNIRRNDTSILLAHSPEVYQRAAHAGFEIMLCGHTHGGQLCLPGGMPILLETDCPREYCVRGWRYQGLQGYTSVGAGSSIVDLRFNNRPEVTLHRLQCGGSR